MKRLFPSIFISLITLLMPLERAVSAPFYDLLEEGDFIFREGTEFVSDVVRSLDNDLYSHVGMVTYEEGAWKVIHATPDEIGDGFSGVVIDSIEFFLAKERSDHFAIYRVKNKGVIAQSATQFARLQQGVPFHYDVAQGTYCTRLIYDAYQAADLDLEVEFSAIRAPMVSGDYLFPSQLRGSKKIELIYQGRYTDLEDH